jgi:hypothetical protein
LERPRKREREKEEFERQKEERWEVTTSVGNAPGPEIIRDALGTRILSLDTRSLPLNIVRPLSLVVSSILFQ